MAVPFEPVDREDLVRRYLAGESVNALAKAAGVSRPAIERQLVRAGVQMRTQSEAEAIKWSRMSAEQRARQVGPAHAATLGVPKDDAWKEAVARGQERSVTRVGRYEAEIRDALVARGLAVRQQAAVGTRNVDLAVDHGRLAVEIIGCQTPVRLGPAFAAKTKSLLDADWSVLWIYSPKVPPDFEAVAQYAVTWLEALRGDEAPRRQYRVIGGDAKAATASCFQFHRWPDVAPT